MSGSCVDIFLTAFAPFRAPTGTARRLISCQKNAGFDSLGSLSPASLDCYPETKLTPVASSRFWVQGSWRVPAVSVVVQQQTRLCMSPGDDEEKPGPNPFIPGTPTSPATPAGDLQRGSLFSSSRSLPAAVPAFSAAESRSTPCSCHHAGREVADIRWKKAPAKASIFRNCSQN